MKRAILALCLATGLLAHAEDTPKEPPRKEEAPREPKPYQVGDKVELLAHKDLAGGADVDLKKALDESKSGLVLIWYAPECPYCHRSVADMTAFKEKQEKNGWKVVGIFSGSSKGPGALTPEQHKSLYAEQKVPFPVLDDREQKYVKPFALSRTPTFAAIRKDGTLGYLGAPWSLKEKTPFLSDWLDAVAGGKEPPAFDPAKMSAWG